MNVVGDALLVMRTIQGFTQAAHEATAIFMQMRDEDRDTLTPEELAILRSRSDLSRQRLVDAIEAQAARESGV